jgi:hypothetical protein
MTQAPVTFHLSSPTGEPDNLTGGALYGAPARTCQARLSSSIDLTGLRPSVIRALPVSLSGSKSHDLKGSGPREGLNEHHD